MASLARLWTPWLLASRGLRVSSTQNLPIRGRATFSSQPSWRAEESSKSSVSRVQDEAENIQRQEPQDTAIAGLEGLQVQILDAPSTELTTAEEGEAKQLVDLPRWPRAVQAVYLRPLRREPTYGHPSCDLQLRSYSVRNLEFFCDFAMRAAYYLKLPAFGPVPLPRIVERWTVPKSNFIFKKSQENFERRTLRRLIQIKDGHPDTVELWLAYLRKHAYHGIGMKANTYTFGAYDFQANKSKKVEAASNESTKISPAPATPIPATSAKSAKGRSASPQSPQSQHPLKAKITQEQIVVSKTEPILEVKKQSKKATKSDGAVVAPPTSVTTPKTATAKSTRPEMKSKAKSAGVPSEPPSSSQHPIKAKATPEQVSISKAEPVPGLKAK